MSDAVFESLAEKLFNKYLEQNPQHGSQLGLHKYDGKISGQTQADFDKEIVVYRKLKEELNSIDREKLSAVNKYDYDIANWGMDSELFELEELEMFKRNPMYYAFIFGGLENYISRDYAPFDERLRSIINLLVSVPEILNAAEENLDPSLPEVLCRYAKNFSAGYEDFFKNKLLQEIKEKSSDQKLIDNYISTSTDAVTAFQKFTAFIGKASSPENESYRLGKENFEKMLRIKEQIDVPVEELKKLGYKELERLKTGLKKVIAENNFEGKLETLEHNHPKEENLIDETKNTLDELINFIRVNEVINLPERLNCEVKEMPRYSNFGFAAMGTAGPFEKSDESFYYVNLPDLTWDDKKKEEWMTQFNYPTLKLISIHEAYPGHYTHFLNSNEYSTKLSKIFTSYSYIEGWAHYTEEMMIDQGYSKEDFRSRIGMLLEALIRCCRYIVAIGIHCEGMSINEAKDFFLKNAHMNEVTALQEAERGAFDPGYLNYTLGKIYLKQFMTKYFNKFDGKKTLKDFHDKVVSLGAPTYSIAEKYVLQ
ncbi:MAG: DUF885 domain-containing protein [Ignavibacteria bacterium]